MPAAKWINLRNIKLSERRQMHRTTCCYEIQRKQIYTTETESSPLATKGWGEGGNTQRLLNATGVVLGRWECSKTGFW